MTLRIAAPASSPLPDEVHALLTDPAVQRIIVATAADGTPLPAVSPELRPGDDGRLLHLEFAESSDTAKSLLGSLWFDRPVAVLLLRPDGSGARILGHTERAVITGPLFQQFYVETRERLGEIGLAAIWVIRPGTVEVFDRSRWVYDESAQRPFFTHLDRLAKA
jgi:hypothetical protein